MTDVQNADTIAARLHRELTAATEGKPWKTLGLVRAVDRKGVRFHFREDLGRALADPEFLAFCSMTTSVEQLKAMLLEAGL